MIIQDSSRMYEATHVDTTRRNCMRNKETTVDHMKKIIVLDVTNNSKDRI